MKDRTEYRVKQTLIRSKKLREQKEQRFVKGMSALCIALAVCLLTVINGTTIDLAHVSSRMGIYGTMLLLGDADVYILTGTVAFIAGCVITFLCIRLHNKKKHDSNNDSNDDNDNNDNDNNNDK